MAVSEREMEIARRPDTPQTATPAAHQRKPDPQADETQADETLYLIGRPKAKHFIRFARQHAVDAPPEDALLERWQAAKSYLDTLKDREAGAADDAAIKPIDVGPKYEPLLVDFLRDPLVRSGFNTVPTEVAFVELDRMVVYQKYIDLTHVRRLQQQIGSAPSDEDIFRACLPYNHPQPPAKWTRIDDDGFVFVSPSNDLRFLGAMPLGAEHVHGYPHPGALVGVIGLAVGFGSNFLNAIACENRLILNNGSHRAYALRELGYTHVPCVVQHAATRDELDLIASSDLRRDPDQYLREPRPAMLKDYFDPQLRAVMRVHRIVRQVKLRFSVSEHYVPSL